jgi:hypothetical protein
VSTRKELPEGEEPCEFKSEAVRGYDIDELSDLHLKLGEGFIGSVALSGAPIISPDVRSDPVYINARDRTRSEMVAPDHSRTTKSSASSISRVTNSTLIPTTIWTC